MSYSFVNSVGRSNMIYMEKSRINQSQILQEETPTFHKDCDDVDNEEEHERSIFEEVGHHLIKKYGKIHYYC